MSNQNIGNTTLEQFTIGSHNWGADMNINFLKASFLINPTVEEIGPPPASPPNLYAFIDDTSDKIRIRFSGTWYNMNPDVGLRVYVVSENAFYIWDGNEWRKFLEAQDSAEAPKNERLMSFFDPGAIEPDVLIFHALPSIPFALPAGATGSLATLETAPSANIVFGLLVRDQIGTVTFPAGSTSGTFNIPAVATRPPFVEAPAAQPDQIAVWLDSNNGHGAAGLALTLLGS